MIIAGVGLLCALIGALVAEFTVGWTYKHWWYGTTEFNEDAIIYVVIGFVIGIVIGCLIELILMNRKQNNTKTKHPSNIDEISKLKTLLDNGIITQEEFDEKKKQLLGL